MKNIPKIAHFYWDSPTGLSFLRAMTIVSFHKFNPEWKIFIHKSTQTYSGITWSSREHQVPLKKADNYDLLEDIPIKWVTHDFEKYKFHNDVPEVYKADYLRWILLHKHGGLWSDFDILYLNPVRLLKLKKYFDSAICIYPTNEHAIGFLLGAKGSSLWKKVSNDARKKFNRDEYQSIGSAILNSYPKEAFKKSTYIPTETVYPLSITRPDNFWAEPSQYAAVKSNIGIHWYAGHPKSIEWDNKLTQDNYNDYNNTICEALRSINNLDTLKK